MKTTSARMVKAIFLCAFGLIVAALGIYIGQTDDSPGVAILGIVIMLTMIALAVRSILRSRASVSKITRA